jgi:hypothetical protein
MTEKWPAQSSRPNIRSANRPPIFSGAKAQQYDTAHGRQCRCLGQLTKVFEGEQNPFLADGLRQHFGVAAARCRYPDPDNIAPGRSKSR